MSHLALAILSGLLYAASFPKIDLNVFAWACLVPLLVVCLRTSPRHAFWLGWVSGVVAFVGTVYWVVIAMHRYGNVPLVPSLLILLLFSAFLGGYVALFSLMMRLLLDRARPTILIWAAPPLWVALELLRTHVFSGFPWALLGYSQYRWLPVIQIADITGVYGVSFLVVLINALIAVLIHEAPIAAQKGDGVQRSALLAPCAAALVLLTATLGYGYWKLAQLSTGPDGRSLRIGLVQANIAQDRKWDPAFRAETMNRYRDLTMRAINLEPRTSNLDLVIWPEAATPFAFEREGPERQAITTLVHRSRTPLLFGSIAIEHSPGQEVRMFNRAYLLSPQGAILTHYDKIHLVPFGEYVPRLFAFLDKLVYGIGDYVPGKTHTVMRGPFGQFGVAICFEVIYPNLVRKFVKQGAEYIVTITNDAWYDRSSAPWQHFSMVVLRAVENRVAFVRAANTGISGFIDADGRIRRSSPLFEQAVVVDTVPLGYDPSLYTIYGDIFAYGCTAFAVGLMILMQSPRGRRRRAGRRPRQISDDASTFQTKPSRFQHSLAQDWSLRLNDNGDVRLHVDPE